MKLNGLIEEQISISRLEKQLPSDIIAAIVVEYEEIEEVRSTVSVILTTSDEFQTDSEGSVDDQGDDMNKILHDEVDRQVAERLEREEQRFTKETERLDDEIMRARIEVNELETEI